jgi:hypothetical protein
MKPICFLILFLTLTLQAQNSENTLNKKLQFGTEFQFYPAGFMPTFTANFFIKEKLALRVRIGGNFADRSGFSSYNDEEKAKGFGGTFGVQRFFPIWKGNFVVGIYMDGWHMWTDWKDNVDTTNPEEGRTYNFVVQPWLNAGYLFQLSPQWNAGLTLGVGREFNVITNGEKVGEGWMGILTIAANYTFKR